ncbi:MAG: hypothetical protein E3J86_08735 [Candidatus Thorarchaeota archaeon]|nr:MAG: hypothetical protein E3J86_08735 [Candidatus Thorarchaeota archaeon]
MSHIKRESSSPVFEKYNSRGMTSGTDINSPSTYTEVLRLALRTFFELLSKVWIAQSVMTVTAYGILARV